MKFSPVRSATRESFSFQVFCANPINFPCKVFNSPGTVGAFQWYGRDKDICLNHYKEKGPIREYALATHQSLSFILFLNAKDAFPFLCFVILHLNLNHVRIW